MIVSPTVEPEDARKAVDKFIATAYNSPALMKFIQIAVDTFDRKGTMQLALHVKAGEAKGGNGSFSF